MPAGDTFEYRCELTLMRPGPFESVMDIHLEDNGIRTVRIRVSGTVMGEVPNAPPSK